jgi:hypothetical protein
MLAWRHKKNSRVRVDMASKNACTAMHSYPYGHKQATGALDAGSLHACIQNCCLLQVQRAACRTHMTGTTSIRGWCGLATRGMPTRSVQSTTQARMCHNHNPCFKPANSHTIKQPTCSRLQQTKKRSHASTGKPPQSGSDMQTKHREVLLPTTRPAPHPIISTPAC